MVKANGNQLVAASAAYNGNNLAAYSKTPLLEFVRETGRAFAAYIPNTTEDQGRAIALTCFLEGLTPEQFKRKYHWIPGVGSAPRAAALFAEFRLNHGGRYIVIENSPRAAEVKFFDAYGNEYTRRNDRMAMMLSRWPYAKEDAKAGRLGWQKANAKVYELRAAGKTEDEIFIEMMPSFKDNWGTEEDWKNMLMARLSHEFVSICPELSAGVCSQEELADIEDAQIVRVDLNPASPTPTAVEIINAAASDNSTPPFDVPAEPAAAAADVIDAEFTPTESQVEPTEPLGNGYATRSQITKLLDLSTELGISLDQAMARRGIRALHSFTTEDATAIIAKLEAEKQNRAISGN